VSPPDAKKTSAKSSGFSYKVPDNRYTTFGGVLRDDDGDIVNAAAAAESDESSAMRDDLLPVDYVVITELSEVFQRAVSHRCFAM